MTRPPTQEEGTPLTRCEWCGADYDPGVRPTPDVHARPVPGVETDEPVTHCEFCGAEYPTPGEAPADRATDTPSAH
jgi:hypothetical protein